MANCQISGELAASVRAHVGCLDGEWVGDWFDSHYGRGWRSVRPAAHRQAVIDRLVASVKRTHRVENVILTIEE